jgi:hypothetical protein
MKAKIVMTETRVTDKRVDVFLMWHEGDPFAVSLLIEQPPADDVLWEFDLNLLYDAFSKGAAGIGDITLVDSGEYMTAVFMNTSVVLLTAAGVKQFLSAISKVQNTAEEVRAIVEADLDQELELILNG